MANIKEIRERISSVNDTRTILALLLTSLATPAAGEVVISESKGAVFCFSN